MSYRALADLVALVHLGFIAFVVVGGFLALRWRRLPWLHVPAVLWGLAVELAGWWCPLTPLENWLREAAGAEAYAGGFVDHYVLPLVYPPGLTRRGQLLLGLGLAAINALAYGLVCWRWRSRPGGCRISARRSSATRRSGP